MNSRRNGGIGETVCAAFILFLCSAAGLKAVEFAGGTGESNDPYQIATAEQLIGIGSDPNLASKHFVLVDSIDLSGTTWSSAVIPFFFGSFDGDGFVIRGLTARSVGSLGLFGQIANAGRVTNLHMEGVDLTVAGYVGGLAAYNEGIVSGCSVAGNVVGVAHNAGGLVGYNRGVITGSFSAANVTGYSLVGGLVGTNAGGILKDCHSTAVVFGNSAIGGLAGSNIGSVSGCYGNGLVIGADNIGGLVGGNSGGISSCYSMGSVIGGNDAGGLVGYNAGQISLSYSVAGVTSEGGYNEVYVGGLVGGFANLTSVVRDSYFLSPVDGGGPNNGIGTRLTAAEMNQQASFTGWDFWGAVTDGDHWFMPAGAPPVLVWQTEITGLQRVPDVTGLPLDRAKATLTAAGFVLGDVSYDHHRGLPAGYAIHAEPYSVARVGETIDLVASSGQAYDWAANPGDGTEADPYQIQTAGQLESLSDHPELWDRHFILTADLDLLGRTYSTALVAFGAEDGTAGFQGTPFTGTFDGQDHTIRNLFIRPTDDRQHLGLFGTVGETGRIGRLHLAAAFVGFPATAGATRRSTATYAGILAGSNYGAVTDCSAVDCILIGFTSADGLVGVNQGSVANCSADVTIVRTSGLIR